MIALELGIGGGVGWDTAEQQNGGGMDAWRDQRIRMRVPIMADIGVDGTGRVYR